MLRMQKTPRPHQEHAITLLRKSLGSNHRRPILQLPTGGGKTFVSAMLVKMATAKGNRVTFTVPAISLIDQTVAAFMAEGIDDIGVIQGDHPMQDWSKPVQIASVQTLARRCFPESDMVIVDEAHQQFDVIYRWMDTVPEIPFIGLTATPWAKGLGKRWDDLLIAATTSEMIEAGHLSDFRVYAPDEPDLSGVKVVAGDYHKQQLGDAMGGPSLVANVADTWLRLGEGRPTLVFAVNRAHAKALQKQFEARGVGAGYIDAYTERQERAAIEKQLARGEISVVCNVGCLTTGVDWDVRCIVLARPTKSKMLFVQMIGRGLRTAEGKADCLILDHSNSHTEMGFVTDIHEVRLNDGTPQKSQSATPDEPLPKPCAKCGYVKPPKVSECPGCGFVAERQSTVQTVEGKLAEIKKRKPTRAECQSFYSGLLTIRSQRNRSSGWVAHTYREKFGVWPRGLSDAPSEPSADVLNYVKSKDIRFAKRRAK